MSGHAATGALVCVGLAASACHGAQTSLDAAGPQAAHIRDLGAVFLGVTTFVFVAVVAALAVALLRRRSSRDARRAAEPGESAPGTERRLRVVVTVATVVSVGLLFVLLGASVRTGRALASLPADGALRVQVIGHQWWWEVRYPGDAPAELVVAANEIHIPAGRTVELELSTRDVIHSFWVPRLHGKRDLIPGEVRTLRLRADEPGIYRGQCAEFCGVQHARMSFEVVAEPPDRFQAWLVEQRRPARAPDAPDAQRGQQLFMQRACASCHNISGSEAGATVGPDLTHVASRRAIAALTLPNGRAHLDRWLADTQGVKPGVNMPNVPLSDGDRAALVAYLETLR